MAPATPKDELDDVVNLEQNFESEGRVIAEESGKAAGIKDGRDLGWATGASLTAELEFYHGGAAAILALSTSHPDVISDRCAQLAEKLLKDCNNIALWKVGNDDAIDMEAHSEQVRTNFRRMMAFASLGTVRYVHNSSRLADLSF